MKVCMSADIMARMVVQQPQSVMVMNTTYSNQWSSGICDCCENVAECESSFHSFSNDVFYCLLSCVCIQSTIKQLLYLLY